MTKAFVVGLLLLHGAIHGLGFAKAFGVAKVAQLAVPISRPWGVVWGVCLLLFVGAAAARLISVPWWWLLGAAGVVASQVAIVMFWSDARFGTVANALLLVPILVGFGSWRFAAHVEADVAALSHQVSSNGSVVQASELVGTPQVVESWLRHAGVVGKPRVRAVHLTQRGEMKKSPNADWISFRAEQWFTVAEPGFVWSAEVEGPLGTSLAARDRYFKGKGTMRIELLSLVPVVNAHGHTIDQGAQVRYLAETMWFPSAALEPYVEWEAIDERTARATLRHAGAEVAGLFRFSDTGDVIGFEAKRYREGVLEDWIIENDQSAIEVVDGVRIPTRSTVTWRNEAGRRWTWLRLKIVTLNRDPAALSERPQAP